MNKLQFSSICTRSPPTTRKFPTGSSAPTTTAVNNLSLPTTTRNRSRSRSPNPQQKSMNDNSKTALSPVESSQVSKSL